MHNSPKNRMVIITINKNGDILNKNLDAKLLLEDHTNIFEVENLRVYKDILIENFATKKLLVNIFPNRLNYTLLKIPLEINGFSLFQCVIEEWRMNTNVQCLNNNKFDKNIVKNLGDVYNYSLIEQEVIYSLLLGFVQDKDINNFLLPYHSCTNSRQKINLKYNLYNLYDKFQAGSRTSLIQSLKFYKLDRYIPETIIKPGVYDCI